MIQTACPHSPPSEHDLTRMRTRSGCNSTSGVLGCLGSKKMLLFVVIAFFSYILLMNEYGQVMFCVDQE